MVAASPKSAELCITWDPLPEDFKLDEKPVENTGQPLLAGALRESLELSGWIQPKMLIASNFGLCATMNKNLVIKAPDWLYVAKVNKPIPTRKAYTPNLEGEVPADGYWLRWWDANGQLLPWAVEKVAAVTQKAEQERQRAERLAEILRAQGIDPDTVIS
ncbi:hypothetical protein [Leptothoe spongobia]|uniref:Uncharacterized protein n=1 Tax=Leptothoe spongobia TAU-MAC 1115 TaxID=1967444 RepID=A0A947GI21_9CYAN|nr:hypothetical protein [Leptothoe spongobia]MBT9314517.1 hypothetical protein [Leptothoe spongobia TAU-MAC 1115]